MAAKNKKLILTITLITFLSDQVIKHKIRQLGGFYVCNSGISLGIQIPFEIYWIIFLILSLLCIIIINKKKLFLSQFGLILILSGAISNLYDRLEFNCVTDYIKIFNKFPIINLADVWIFIGSFLVAVALITQDSEQTVNK